MPVDNVRNRSVGVKFEDSEHFDTKSLTIHDTVNAYNKIIDLFSFHQTL